MREILDLPHIFIQIGRYIQVMEGEGGKNKVVLVVFILVMMVGVLWGLWGWSRVFRAGEGLLGGSGGDDGVIEELGRYSDSYGGGDPEYSIEYYSEGEIVGKEVYFIDGVFYTYKLTIRFIPEGYNDAIDGVYFCSRTTYREVRDGENIGVYYAYDRKGRVSINIIEVYRGEGE